MYYVEVVGLSGDTMKWYWVNKDKLKEIKRAFSSPKYTVLVFKLVNSKESGRNLSKTAR